MDITTGIIVFVVGFVMGAVMIWVVRQRELDASRVGQGQLKDQFATLSREALDQNMKSFLEVAGEKFKGLLSSSDVQLEEKKKLIDAALGSMNEHLKGLNKQTIELKTELTESKSAVGKLGATTDQLRQILSSSQARGQWGERMVEDILNLMGLAEGINYDKQTAVAEGRPDFTFHLPAGKTMNMDVKFPLVHYEKYLVANNDVEKKVEKKAFLGDVRKHVKAIAGRSYIDISKGTVDYVLMFIPNESIYSFINQEDHELIDFSLERRIVLCSPITLYAVLSLVRQAVENFSMEEKAGEMQALVVQFSAQWERFVEKIEKMGGSLDALSNHYHELSSTRLRQLEKPMDKIKELQLGHPGDGRPLEGPDS
ncbi:MAG: DNA recombination protein RmuC [Planctomycetes bacterium]|jgi:DNA recombination protein RmuC|nr:DNA recombination protein RmuC [Planctomycetota bacterium]